MAVEQRIYDLSLDSARDLSLFQYHVIAGSGVFTGDLAGAADMDSVGILQGKPAAAGRAMEVRRVGISKAVCGGTIPVWSRVTPDANGHIVVAATGEYYIGRAMQIGADNRVIAVLMEFGFVHDELS